MVGHILTSLSEKWICRRCLSCGPWWKRTEGAPSSCCIKFDNMRMCPYPAYCYATPLSIRMKVIRAYFISYILKNKYPCFWGKWVRYQPWYWNDAQNSTGACRDNAYWQHSELLCPAPAPCTILTNLLQWCERVFAQVRKHNYTKVTEGSFLTFASWWPCPGKFRRCLSNLSRWRAFVRGRGSACTEILCALYHSFFLQNQLYLNQGHSHGHLLLPWLCKVVLAHNGQSVQR